MSEQVTVLPMRRALRRAGANALVCLVAWLVIGMAAVHDAATAMAAEKRFALVIGNSNYVNAAKLRNAANDARDLAAKLQSVGFDVTLGVDVDYRSFNAKVLEFRDKLRDGQAHSAVFFYAGHGFTLRGRNRLVPVDAALDSKDHADESTLVLDRVMDFIQPTEDQQTVILLDACRNNPLPKKQQDEGSEQGLARLANDAPNIAVLFATKPGNVTQDGLGQNSPFTTALLSVLNEPGLDYGQVVQKVYIEVNDLTAGQQRPDQQGILPKPFIFNQSTEDIAAAPPPAPPPPPRIETPQVDTQSAEPDSPPVLPSSGEGTEVTIDGTAAQTVPNENAGAATLPDGTQIALNQDSSTRSVNPIDNTGASLNSSKNQVPEVMGKEVGAEPPDLPPEPNPLPGTPAPEPPAGKPAPSGDGTPGQQASLGESPTDIGPTGATFMAIETALKRVGCFTDSPDAIWNTQSQQALSTYLGKKGQDTAEQPSDALLLALESEKDTNVCVAAVDKPSKLDQPSPVTRPAPSKPASVRPNTPKTPKVITRTKPPGTTKAAPPQPKPPAKKRQRIIMGL